MIICTKTDCTGSDFELENISQIFFFLFLTCYSNFLDPFAHLMIAELQLKNGQMLQYHLKKYIVIRHQENSLEGSALEDHSSAGTAK